MVVQFSKDNYPAIGVFYKNIYTSLGTYNNGLSYFLENYFNLEESLKFDFYEVFYCFQ